MNQDVRSQLGIAAYSLFTIKVPASDPSPGTYEVMEAREDVSCAPMDCAWMPVEHIESENFNEEDSSAVSAAIREMRSYARGWAIGPFGKPGWLEDLLCWVQKEIEPRGLRLSGDLRQFNPCPMCALLRMETNGSAVWFKAVDETNVREVSIATALARELPVYVPSVIATHPSLHGWLTTECEGLTLSEIDSASAWEEAAEAIAKLQIESRGKIDELLNAGCRDLRIEELLRQADAFMEVMAELMERQEKVSPPALTKKEVIALGASIKQAITDWPKLNIPDGLGHLDISPHNIIVSPDRCVFLDWGEAYVGPPFLTLDFLRGHFRQSAISEGGLDFTLVTRYRKQWEFILPVAVVTEGLEIAQLLAPFAYALGMDHWRDREKVFSSENAGYFRSLIRRMHRESRKLQERRRACLNS
ncbi:MAG: phosphotransferase [Terriglobia bacterium]|nr:phosphotransferase [Terriglobia bacterium]